jgi:NTE family protein
MVLRADAVFEGGGVRGIAFVGALEVAEEEGYRWVNVAGTSAGAIVAALLAAGYTAREMADILKTLDYTRFRDTSWLDRIPLVGPLLSLIFENGIYEGDYFLRWMRGLLRAKGVRTFGDLILQEFSDDERYRFRLRVIASDISRGEMLVLPQDIVHYGMRPEGLEVALAVRMSMSIPFYFEPVYLRDRRTGRKSCIVDGGILSNFPVWLFDTEEEPLWPTFGFRLSDYPEGRAPQRSIRGPVSLLSALFSTMMAAHDARHIREQDFVRTIVIPTLGVESTDFSLSRDKAEALYASGKEAARRFFARWDFKGYVERYRRGARQSPPPDYSSSESS